MRGCPGGCASPAPPERCAGAAPGSPRGSLCPRYPPPDPPSAAPSVPASVSPQLRGTVRGRRRDHARLKGRHPRPPPRRPPLSPRACRCTQSQRCQSRRAPPPEGSAVSVRPTPAPPRPHPRSAAVGRCLGGGGERIEGEPPRRAHRAEGTRTPRTAPGSTGAPGEALHINRESLRGATALRVPPPHAPIPVPPLPRSPRTAAPRIAAPGGAAASPPPSPRTPIPARQPRPCPPPAGSRSRTALRRRSGGAGAAGGQRQQQRGGGGGGGSGLSAARSPPGDSSDGDSADGDRGGGGGGGGTSGGRSSNRRPSPPAGPGGSSGGAALWRRGAGSGAGRCAPGFFSNFSSGFMAAERLAGPWAVRGGAGRRGGAAPLALGLRRGGGAPAPPPRPAPPGTCPPPAPGGASRSRVAPPARSAAQLRSPPYAHGALTQRASHAAPPPPQFRRGKSPWVRGGLRGGSRCGFVRASPPSRVAWQLPAAGGGSGGGGRTQPCPRVSPPRAAPRCAPFGPSALSGGSGRETEARLGGGTGNAAQMRAAPLAARGRGQRWRGAVGAIRALLFLPTSPEPPRLCPPDDASICSRGVGGGEGRGGHSHDAPERDPQRH